MTARTLFDKVWESHLVTPETADQPAVLYVDLHLVHEVTSPQAFAELRRRDLSVRCPHRTVATMDHSIPTLPADADGQRAFVSDAARNQVWQLEQNCAEFGIELHGWQSPHRGVVHVMGPELGHTQPGMTIVCGDSHTSTHGAFGALAFGIGTSEVGDVLATQCLLQRKPKSMAVEVRGTLGPGVTAKDLALAIISKIGVGGGTGHVIEYRGEAIRALPMESRMTLCNMSIEAGARAGMIAPDDTTFRWLKGRPHAPSGAAWDEAVERWAGLVTDEDAPFDHVVHLDASEIRPMMTWGTTPSQAMPVDGAVPQPVEPDDRTALEYMALSPGARPDMVPVNVVFIGSCTNGRLSDLRAAAGVMRGRTVHEGVRMLVVPGSWQVKQAAEAEGLDRVFTTAGAEWREPGCSMCIAMNGDLVAAGELAVSTSNRNFAGRQGHGARTVLASPATAAASAVRGVIADPRPFLLEADHDAA